MCWRDFFFLFFWRCDQFSFWTKWALRHITYSEKWEMPALLRWFLSQEQLQLNFSLSFPLSMLLQAVPDLPIDSFTNQYTIPLAAAEVGFCRASPGVGFRGNGHIIISVLFQLFSPSDGSHFCQELGSSWKGGYSSHHCKADNILLLWHPSDVYERHHIYY